MQNAILREVIETFFYGVSYSNGTVLIQQIIIRNRPVWLKLSEKVDEINAKK